MERPWSWGERPGRSRPLAGKRRLDSPGGGRHRDQGPGIDLLATSGDRWLAVELNGYPNTTYDHGPKRGMPKPTQPSNQARQWFSHALLGMMLLRDRRPDAEIAICFPRITTYENLARRTRLSFELLGFGVYFVDADGAVELALPHRPVSDR